MTPEREQDALRDEFQRLRSETEGSARVPDFGAMVSRAKEEAASGPTVAVHGRASRRPRRAFVVGGWATVALAAAVAGVLLVDSRREADADFERLVASYSSEAAGGAWSSPTGSLLEVPGMSYMRTMPSVGDPLRDFDPSRLSEPPKPEGRDS